MGPLPELAYDPADMPALRRKLAAMPEAHAFQDFELARVEIGPEAIRSLPPVLGELARRRVLETFAPVDPSGKMGAECWSDYQRKLAGWRRARPEFESFLTNWDEERERLRELGCSRAWPS